MVLDLYSNPYLCAEPGPGQRLWGLVESSAVQNAQVVERRETCSEEVLLTLMRTGERKQSCLEGTGLGPYLETVEE